MKPLLLALLSLSLTLAPPLQAQKNKRSNNNSNSSDSLPPRPSEKQVLLEKEFIEATQQKILGNTDEAINKFLDVLKKDNDLAAAHFELSLLYHKQKQRDKALQRAERALQLDRENLHYLKHYTVLLEDYGDFLRAAKLYEERSKRQPEKVFFYYEWAYFLDRAEKPDQAIKVYDLLEKRQGPHFDLSLRKHKLYRSLNKDKKAIEELERWLKRQPQDLQALSTLANYFQTTKRPDRALELFRQILNIDAKNAQANVALAEVFKREGDTLRYLQALNSAFEDPNQSPETKFKVLQPLVQDYPNQKDPKRRLALQTLAKTLSEVHTEYAKAHLLLANLYYLDDQLQSALQAYERSLSLDLNNLEAWYYLLQSLNQLRMYEALGQRASRAADLFPDQAFGYYFQGLAAWHRGDYPKVIEIIEPAILMAASLPSLQIQMRKILGSALLQTGQTAKGDKTFEKALESQPNNPELLSEYSRCLAQRPEKINQALQMARQANDISPNTPLYQANFAYVLYQQQNYTEAKTWLERAMNNGGADDPQILELMGDVWFRLGEANRALEQWQRAADRSPYAPANLRKKIQTRRLLD